MAHLQETLPETVAATATNPSKTTRPQLDFQQPLDIRLRSDRFNCSVDTFTQTPVASLFEVSSWFDAYAHQPMRWCAPCNESHPPYLVCFSDEIMDTVHRDILADLVDAKLSFEWTSRDNHIVIFQVCQYFQFSDDYLLPFFLNSLKPDYAQFPDHYNYLSLLYTMNEARYDVLAAFLLDYFNKHSFSLFIPPSLLFRARSLCDFLSAVHSLPNPTSLTRKHLASLIHNSSL